MSARGYTMAELLVVIAIIAVTIGVSIPTLWTYYRSAALRGAAEQTVSNLNGARQLAIRLNTTVCVTVDTTGMQYHQGTCTAPAYTGPGTDASGYMKLDTGMTLSAHPGLCFSYLGAGVATPAPCTSAGTLTITRAQGGTMTVVMATTGRVRIQ
jgi:prepilin-type N-terminal cleavage/methylation domain-containing protein